jgi:hypothetical protein
VDWGFYHVSDLVGFCNSLYEEIEEIHKPIFQDWVFKHGITIFKGGATYISLLLFKKEMIMEI